MKPKLSRFGFAIFIAAAASPFFTQTGFADPTTSNSNSPPITQQQFKAWTDWAKKSVETLDKNERRAEATQAKLNKQASQQAPQPTQGQEVDLMNVTEPSTSSQANLGVSGQELSNTGPKLTTYFDLNFINQPGTTDSLAFDNYHTFVFFDITPAPDLTFSFNLLGPTVGPIYYELDYRPTKALTLRAGKIWIPFDDLSAIDPHNIFGGRVGIQQLMPSLSGNTGNGGGTFLPAIWTELGVGAKLMLLDTKPLQVETDLCIVNGFSSGGTDPVTQGGEYPSIDQQTPGLSGASSTGNHRNKSIAARAHGLLASTFGLGISYYEGQWNPDSDPTHLNLNIIGLDGQVHLFGIDFRMGIATESINLPGSVSITRGGSYGELGIPFAKKWKILGRLGSLQMDSRLPNDAEDETVVGGTILYNPGMVQFSLEHSRNVIVPAGTVVGFVSFTDLRMVMAF